MADNLPFHIMRENSRTRKYRAWLERCVVLIPGEKRSPRQVEADLMWDQPGFCWIARPFGSGYFLLEAPLEWRRRVIFEGDVLIGENYYEVKSALDKEVRGLLEPKALWVIVHGIPPDYSDIDSLRDLFSRYGYVFEMCWYNSENLDLRYMRVRIYLPDKKNVPEQMLVMFVDEVVEGFVVVSVDVEGEFGPNFVPGPQNVNEVEYLKEIIEEIEAAGSGGVRVKEKKSSNKHAVMKEVKKSCGRRLSKGRPNYDAAPCKGKKVMEPAEDSIEKLRLEIMRKRLMKGYNGTAGTGRVWVHPELVTREVRAVLRQRLLALASSRFGGSSSTNIGSAKRKRVCRNPAVLVGTVKRGRGRPRRDGTDGRIAELGPRLGDSNGVEYVDVKVEAE